MLLDNLELSFDRQESGKYIFKNKDNLEISIAEDFFKEWQANNKKFFLAMDFAPMFSSDQNKKNLLNEILDQKD